MPTSSHRPLVRISALLFGLWALVGAFRIGLPSPGLRAQYFATSDWMGTPVRVELEPAVSTEQISRGWRYRIPNAFSIQWSGRVFVSRPGDYAFSVTSAGGSQLFVDEHAIVDTSRLPGVSTGAGRIHLERGAHAVVFRYLTTDGAYRVAWSWALDGEPLAPVPFWRLSPRRVSEGVLLAQRWLGWIWLPLTLACVLLGGRLVWVLGYWPRRSSDDDCEIAACGLPRTRLGSSLLCLALFVALAVVHTWPLASAPGRLSRNDNADTELNEWTMAWVVHEGPRHPLKLFDANIFYPERNALAFSEPLLVQSAMAAPILWLRGSPVLAFNLVLIAGFALTGWTMCLVVTTWTGRWAAGIAAGALVAFNAHTLTRLPHIQAQHAEFLPLALLALDALLLRPRWSAAAWLALWTALQAFASIYLLVFTTLALAVGVLARPEDWLGDRFRRVAPKLAGAAALGAVMLLPLLLPYWRLHQAGFARSLDEAGYFAASVRDYLASQARLYARSSDTTSLFPGVAGLALAGVALATGAGIRDQRARMCLAFGVCGVALSFGPAYAPGYEWLYSHVPLLQAVRVSARFGYLGIVAVAVLAGYGVAALGAAAGSRTAAASVVSIVAVALVAFEPLAAPIDYTPVADIPSIYRLPAADPGAVVVELPFPPPDAPYRNAPYMLASTFNWRPLLNGYSGFIPPSYIAHYQALRDFPSAASIAALQSLGVTHLFVHVDQLSPGEQALLEKSVMLRRLGTTDTTVAYGLGGGRR